MVSRRNQKLKMICLVDILKKYTDEENPLNATELCEKLAEMDVTAERKSIYDDIAALIDYGYDIVKTRTPKIGFFLASREFEEPEVYLLADAVRAANFITPRKTRELVSKLDGMLSETRAASREKITYFDTRRKCDNEEIYYNIDKISSAIKANVKINLEYFRHILSPDRRLKTVKKSMCVTPYALLWQNDHYYLIANKDNYNNLMHLRVDRIKSVVLTDQKAKPVSQTDSGYKDKIDVADYATKTFNMFSGVSDKIELKCNKNLAEQMVDKFSSAIFITKVTDETFNFSVEAFVSDGLVSWLLQFGDGVEVVAPESLKEMLVKKLQAINGLYFK